MDKILKIRKLTLFITLGLVAIGIIISILSTWLTNQYIDEVNKAKIKDVSEIKKTTSALTIIFSLITPWIFYIFAIIYIFRKGNFKVQGRKWPYIVMIVFGSIAIIIGLSQLALNASRITGTIYISNSTDAVDAAVGKIWSASYKVKYQICIILHLIITLAILGLNITQLVLIKKAKNASDMHYSEQIKNFQPKQNDLP